MTQPDTSAITAVVADIGGTNTRVALTQGATIRTETIRRYRNDDETGILPVLQHYLARSDARPQAACVAMAGPVKDGVGTLTNRDWRIDRSEIAQTTGATTVAVLNDMQAQGHALSSIAASDLVEIRPGQPAGDHAARIVLNVGTGLNAALVYRTDNQTLVPPSESGHVALDVQDDEDLRLARFLARSHGFAGAEEALSGRGVANLYAFACHEAGDLPSGLTSAEVMQALEAGDPKAQHAARLFAKHLGRWAGDLALIQLPFGGIYFFGGMVAAFAPYLADLGFNAAFQDKGRFGPFLDPFPVHLVTDDYAPLRGSASHLMELMARQ